MNRTLIIFDDSIHSYCPGLELLRVYKKREKDNWPFVLEFGRKEQHTKEASIIIACKGSYKSQAFDMICDSCIHHPGVIDLRGTHVTPNDVEEE